MNNEQFEEIRKLSRLFSSSVRLTYFLEKDFFDSLPKGAEEEQYYEEFVEQKLKQATDIVGKLESEVMFYNLSGSYDQLKPSVYLIDLLLKYLKNQSVALLEDCDYELSYSANDVEYELRDLEEDIKGDKAELKRIATSRWAQYKNQYRIIEHIVYPFLDKFRVIAADASKRFRGTYDFLMQGLSEETLQIDAATERIGTLLHLSKEKFERVVSNAELGFVEDQRHKKYSKPKELNVSQTIILFDALRNTGGISSDVKNNALGYHLERITNHSEKNIGPNFSNVRELLNAYKNGRNADDGRAVIEYLQKVIAYIERQIE